MPLSYNHVPLIVYSPAFEGMPKLMEQFGGQVDVFPTLMGMLNISYENNTFGIDLFREERPYMFFSSDDAIGCIDSTYFYSYNFRSEMEGIFDYRNNNPENFISQHKALADSMCSYSASMLQAANFMFKNGLTRNNSLK